MVKKVIRSSTFNILLHLLSSLDCVIVSLEFSIRRYRNEFSSLKQNAEASNNMVGLEQSLFYNQVQY